MTASLSPVSRAGRLWRTRVLAHRRVLAAVCSALAVWALLAVVAPADPPTDPVTVAARDLPAGTVLATDDLVSVPWPRGTRPDGLAADPHGRTLAAPLRRGEPVSDLRLVTPSLVEGYPGLMALPVRIPDPAMVSLLRVGDSIDLVATDAESATARVVAAQAPVLALPPETNSAAGQGVTGRLVVLGLAAHEVEDVSVAAARHFLTFAFSR